MGARRFALSFRPRQQYAERGRGGGRHAGADRASPVSSEASHCFTAPGRTSGMPASSGSGTGGPRSSRRNAAAGTCPSLQATVGLCGGRVDLPLPGTPALRGRHPRCGPAGSARRCRAGEPQRWPGWPACRREGRRAGDQRAEDGDCDRSPDLAKGIETALAVPTRPGSTPSTNTPVTAGMAREPPAPIGMTHSATSATDLRCTVEKKRPGRAPSAPGWRRPVPRGRTDW